MEETNTIPFTPAPEVQVETNTIPFTPAPEVQVEDAPAAKLPPKLVLPIVYENNATVEWLEDGAIVRTATMPRSTAEILKYLAEISSVEESAPEKTIRITVKAAADQPLQEDGTPHIILTEGVMGEIAHKLAMSSVPPPQAIAEFQRLSMYLSDHSSLKGIMVTAVFGDAEAGGFGFLSTTSTLTNADVTTLLESAKNQVELFREKIKQSHPDLVFPSESRLVLPNGRPI